MANILYGINGEGSGHWTRSKEIITHLQSLGHNITIVASGRASINLKEDFLIENIAGFSFKFIQSRINISTTVWTNIKALPRFAGSFKKILDLIKARRINLVVTDLEPLSCHAGILKHLPVISIDNQHVIAHTNATYPPKYKILATITKAAIKRMTPGASIYLALSFFKTGPKDAKTLIMPPILRRQVFDLNPSIGDYIVVYVSSGLGKVIELLKEINCTFVVYGTKKDSRDGNVTCKKFEQDEFLKDLAGAKGVLATAGFSLISEALYLGKPYLAWPVKNQFEQIFNAYHVERLGYGKHTNNLSRESIESFLFNLEIYRKNLSAYPRQNNRQVFNKLEELISAS